MLFIRFPVHEWFRLVDTKALRRGRLVGAAASSPRACNWLKKRDDIRPVVKLTSDANSLVQDGDQFKATTLGKSESITMESLPVAIRGSLIF
jgi:hypothetical protein